MRYWPKPEAAGPQSGWFPADEDRRAREDPAPQRAPLAPDPVVPFGPLGFHDVADDEAGGDQFAHPVAERTVVLHVRRNAAGVGLHVRTPVEVRVRGDQPALARIVEEDPAHRMGDREHPAAAGAQHPEHLAHHPCGVGDERHRAERAAREVERGVAERQRLGIGLHQRRVHPGTDRGLSGMAQHSGRQVEPNGVRPLADQPSAARRRPAAHFENPPSGGRPAGSPDCPSAYGRPVAKCGSPYAGFCKKRSATTQQLAIEHARWGGVGPCGITHGTLGGALGLRITAGVGARRRVSDLVSVRKCSGAFHCAAEGPVREPTRQPPTGATAHMTSSIEATSSVAAASKDSGNMVAVDDIGSEEAFLAAIDETIKYFNDGDIVEGTVVKVDRDEVLLDIGYKTEGVIPSRELSIKHDVDPAEVVSVGDHIEALVLQKEDKEGRLILSKKRAQYERAWGTIEKIKEDDGVVRGSVIEVVKGGLILDIGLRGFLPASLVEMRRVRDLQPYVGRELEAKII